MFNPLFNNRTAFIILALVFVGAKVAAANPCETLLMRQTEQRMFLETMKAYGNNVDTFFHQPFDRLLISAGSEPVDYYKARYVAYRLILDSEGFFSQLGMRYLALKNLGYVEPYGRFIDLAHGSLTNHVMRRAKVAPVTEAEVTAVLDDVVRILRP
jgi:hypothetical protein